MTDAEATAPSNPAGAVSGARTCRSPARGGAAAACDGGRGLHDDVRPGASGASSGDGLPLAFRRLGEAFATFDAAVGRRAAESGPCEDATGPRLAPAMHAEGDASR